MEIGTVKSVYHDTVEKGLVVSQSVLNDVDVEVGTTIDIVISLGPKPQEPDQEKPEDGTDETEKPDTPSDTKPEETPDNNGNSSTPDGGDGNENETTNGGENSTESTTEKPQA